MFDVMLNVMAPVFLIGALGYGWARSGRAFDTNGVSGLVVNIGAPCLVIDTLSKIDADFATLGEIFFASVLCHLAFLALGWLVLKISKQSFSTYLPGLLFGNTGNVGLPLCLFAFGQQGLALAIAYFTLSSMLLFTVAPQIASGRAAPLELVKAPLLWGVVIALVMMVGGWSLPPWLGRPVHLLGGMTIPLMLLALGVSLARLRGSSFGRAFAFSLVRVLGGAAIGITVAHFLGLQGIARGVVIVEASMPVAVFNYLFAVRYQNHPEDVAAMVVTSTSVAFAILPFLLGMVMT
jgi:predicted permease